MTLTRIWSQIKVVRGKPAACIPGRTAFICNNFHVIAISVALLLWPCSCFLAAREGRDVQAQDSIKIIKHGTNREKIAKLLSLKARCVSDEELEAVISCLYNIPNDTGPARLSLEIIGRNGGRSGGSVDRILEILSDKEMEETLRACAAETLIKIGSQARKAIPALKRAFELDGPYIRWRCLCAWKAAKPEVRVEFSALRDSMLQADSLGNPDNINWKLLSVDTLCQLVKDHNAQVRYQVIEELLLNRGSTTADFPEDLLTGIESCIVSHPSKIARVEAVALIGRIGKNRESAAASIAKALTRESWGDFFIHIRELGKMGDVGIEALEGTILKTDGEMKLKAAYALLSLDSNSTSAKQAFLGALKDSRVEIRRECLLRIREMTKVSADLKLAVVKLENDPNESVKDEARKTSASFAEAATEATPGGTFENRNNDQEKPPNPLPPPSK